MDVLKAATDWAKAEVFSSQFFILFGLVFVLASIGFWQLGKTEIARAFIIPNLVVGVLLLTIGLGMFFTNKSRVTGFPNSYHTDPVAFVEAEMIRAKKTIKEYDTIVFKVIPLLIVTAALLLLFIDKAGWRAISISTIALLVIILFVDSNAKARIEAYHQQLVQVEKELDN